MSNRRIVDQYNQIAKRGLSDIVASGRYLTTNIFYTRKLAEDIYSKLDLNKQTSLLDLGCNVGIYHKYLADRVRKILGADGGLSIIERANKENKRSNVNYICFDLLDAWPEIVTSEKFDRILVYSVIHFFDSDENVAKFLSLCKSNLKSDGKILLGEVRTKEKYDQFLANQKNKKGLTLRDLKFIFSKTIQNFYTGPLDASGLPLV